MDAPVDASSAEVRSTEVDDAPIPPERPVDPLLARCAFIVREREGTPICEGNGKLGCISDAGECPNYGYMHPPELGITIADRYYSGTTARCTYVGTIEESSFALRVEEVWRAPAPKDVTSTIISGVTSDFGPACGVGIEVYSLYENVRPQVRPGDVLRIRRRSVYLSPEEGAGSLEFRSESGELLLLFIGGDLSLTPKDDWNGLTISMDPAVLCRVVEAVVVPHAISLRTPGGPPCDLDDASFRCCELWSATFEVIVLHATSSTRFGRLVDLSIRKPGFLRPD